MEDESNFTNLDSPQIQEIVSFLEFCTSSYVFAYDIQNDVLSITADAIVKFGFPSRRFSHALRTFMQIVAPEDRAVLMHNIDSITAGTPLTRLSVYHLMDKSGTSVPVKIREKVIPGGELRSSVLVGCIDIEETDDLDKLTGLLSEKQVQTDFEKSVRTAGSLSGFMMEIDIDNFTSFNESEGVETGNKVLNVLAEACRKCCTDGTKAYLLPGRKFLLMNLTQGSADSMRRIYSSLKQQIQAAEYDSNYAFMFTVSAGGIALYKDTSDISELLKKLTFSLNTAKLRGKNNMYLFNASEYNSHLYELDLENELRLSITNNFSGFRIFYQPVVDAKRLIEAGGTDPAGFIIGCEALLRWERPEGSLLGANEIIPLLESSSLIVPVGRWVFMTAFSQCAEWNKTFPDFHMSVNISYVQIKKANLINEVQIALERTHVNPANVVLEITESGEIDSQSIQQTVSDLAALGVQIDIDDFGTGYSNLRYIQDLHANTLKLDYSFIHKAVTEGGKDEKIIEYVTNMAHDLGMTVCMEGIESDSDMKKLGYIKPDKFQGFLFGRPVSARKFEEDNLHISSLKQQDEPAL
jgi:diguanylate cyclase (GGDEF)-like protein